MERLNPCLDLIMEVRQSLDAGEGIRIAIRRFAIRSGHFSEICGRWLALQEKGGDSDIVLIELKSPHRRALLRLLQRGLRGEPVSMGLRDFESEVVDACRTEIDRHLALLPLKLMIPLLLFIVPALLILLVGPLLESLSRSLAGG